MAKNFGTGRLNVSCPRWRRVAPPPDFPQSLAAEQVTALIASLEDLYEECDGQVSCYYAFDNGRTYGDPGECWPASEEFTPEECSECGHDDWTKAEIAQMYSRAMDG